MKKHVKKKNFEKQKLISERSELFGKFANIMRDNGVILETH